MGISIRSFADLIYVSIAVWMQWKLAGWLIASKRYNLSESTRRGVRVGLLFSAVALVAAGCYGVAAGFRLVPTVDWMEWVRGLLVLWGIVSAGVFFLVLLLRQAPPFDPARRRLLMAGHGIVLAAPVAVAWSGAVLGRTDFQVREVDAPIHGLPRDLEGLRIVQLSDIHLGPYLAEADLRRAIAIANETRPQLAIVTGDLITMRRDLLPDCLRALAGLKADAGIYGCLGNHEEVARCENEAAAKGLRMGIRFLRGEARGLRFGDALLNLGGVDWQRRRRLYLAGAETMIRSGAVNLLLCHNPDAFPVSARQGWDLMLAGHTHGGQVTVTGLQRYLNVARFFTPYVYGLYQEGSASAYVNSGIGTVGVPARIGAPPEIALIRLRAAAS